MRIPNADLYEVKIIKEGKVEGTELRYLTPSELNQRIIYLDGLKGIGLLEDYKIEHLRKGFNVPDLTMKELENMTLSDLIKVIRDNL